MIIILVGGLLWAYQLYFGGSTTSETDQTAQQIGAEVLSLNTKLETAQLDKTIFSDYLFGKLEDFTTSLPDQPRGRNNPFDPIGKD